MWCKASGVIVIEMGVRGHLETLGTQRHTNTHRTEVTSSIPRVLVLVFRYHNDKDKGWKTDIKVERGRQLERRGTDRWRAKRQTVWETDRLVETDNYNLQLPSQAVSEKHWKEFSFICWPPTNNAVILCICLFYKNSTHFHHLSVFVSILKFSCF